MICYIKIFLGKEEVSEKLTINLNLHDLAVKITF